MTDKISNNTKNIDDLNKIIPTIRFINHPFFGGSIWSDATPSEYGGCGIPIPEDKELYEKCKKEGTKFYWTIYEEKTPIIHFMRNPSMPYIGRSIWLNTTLTEYKGYENLIPKDKELYEKCKKEGTKFYWTIS